MIGIILFLNFSIFFHINKSSNLFQTIIAQVVVTNDTLMFLLILHISSGRSFLFLAYFVALPLVQSDQYSIRNRILEHNLLLHNKKFHFFIELLFFNLVYGISVFIKKLFISNICFF